MEALTERERKMIADYLPHPPDETLEDGEYYFLQETSGGERLIRVYALDVLPLKDGTEYGIYQKRGNRLVRIGDDPLRGVRMGNLYDNAQDCRERVHWWVDEWEELRRRQREAGNG